MSIEAVRDSTNDAFQDLFEATVEAVNEAVLNSLFAAKTTTGFNGTTVYALPIDETMEILARRGATRVG